MRHRHLCAPITVLVGTLTAAAGPAEEIVYRNLSLATNNVLTASLEVGDQVALAGELRRLSQARIIAHAFEARPYDLAFRIYANDAPGGQPGSLLFEELFQQELDLGPTAIDFKLPGIDVPDTITWTIQDLSGETDVGMRSYNPPSIGSSENQYWVRFSNGNWSTRGPVTYGGNFGASFTAIPAPGAAAVVGGLIVGGALRRRRPAA